MIISVTDIGMVVLGITASIGFFAICIVKCINGGIFDKRKDGENG